MLVEFLTFLSSYGVQTRRRAVSISREILKNPNIQVIPQTRSSFLSGLGLYERRLDKQYSLTDCISMETMRSEGLTEAATNDRHFVQEGFTILLEGENE